jgi:hypothetical protein
MFPLLSIAIAAGPLMAALVAGPLSPEYPVWPVPAMVVSVPLVEISRITASFPIYGRGQRPPNI